MKIQLASDLHLEHLASTFPGHRLLDPAPDAELLVLAGDISNGTVAIDFFRDWPVPVIYIAGNHEFYGMVYEETLGKLQRASQGTAVHFLENQVDTRFEGVRILGCTLWTDYLLSGPTHRQQAMKNAERVIRDHSVIRTLESHRFFSAAQALQRHEQSRQWLQTELAKQYEGQTVVVTHHGPHPHSVHPRYEGDITNTAFVSDLSDLFPFANVWLHGHVHDSFDYTVHGCRVATNPRGYPLNRHVANSVSELQFENPNFQPAFVIDTSAVHRTQTDKLHTSQAISPGWVCTECANKHLGPAIVQTHSFHRGECGICHQMKGVTSQEDFAPGTAGFKR